MIGRLALLFLVVGLGFGAFARLQDLGGRQLAIDEYYTASGIENVLTKGLPEFSTGGYYTQGLLPAYLAAAFALALGETPLAYRLPAALCSLLSIVLAYVYARRLLERSMATAVVLCLALSSWNVEFARFARMYAALQLVTLLFLIAIHRAYFETPAHGRYLPHCLAVLAVLTHELGVVLAPLLFVPLLPGVSRTLPTRAEKHRYGAVSAVVTATVVGLISFDVRDWGVSDRFPAGFTIRPESPLRSPVFPFWGGEPATLVLFGCALGLAVILLAASWRHRPRVEPADILVALTVAVCALHQFAVAALLVVLLVLRHQLHQTALHPLRRYVLLGLAMLAAFSWIVLATSSTDWIESAATGGFPIRRPFLHALRVTFLGWPDFYEPVLRPWQAELPRMGLLAGAALAFQLATKRRDAVGSLARNPGAPILYLIFALALLRSPYNSTRYAFLLYPSILITIALSTSELVPRLVARLGILNNGRSATLAAITFAVLFAATEDFNPTHLARITSEEVSFRLGRWEPFAPVWYWREDFESPARFVDSALEDDDTSSVIVIDKPPVSYYLGMQHAVYYARSNPRFARVSREQGTLDLWSGQRLVSTPEELARYTLGKGPVWLIRSADPDRHPFELDTVWGRRIARSERAYISRDRRIEVVRVDLVPEAG